MVVTKEEALELFADNPFKVSILNTKVPDGSRTTVYKCGDLIDLCRGPHVTHTGKIKAFATTRHSATNWLGDTDNDTLQRMYGISFPDKKMLKVWQENQEKVRDIVDSTPFNRNGAMTTNYSNLILGEPVTENNYPIHFFSELFFANKDYSRSKAII
jgi:alanyl-tRNA synthetase